MDQLLRAISAPLFVLQQGTINGWGAFGAVVLIAALVFALLRSRPAKQGLRLAAAMPGPWIILALAAGWNWTDPGRFRDSDGYLTGVVLIVLLLTLGLSVAAVVRIERGRLVTIALAVINAWFAFLAGLLSIMMMTGAWM